MTAVAYLNGAFLPQSEACVPVLDRGFLFADGVYEVIPVYGGKAFAIQQHLARLERSLRELRIDNPHSAPEWQDLVAGLIEKNACPEPGRGSGGDLLVYLQVTRGAPPTRGHAFPAGTRPTIVGLCSALPVPGGDALRNGVAVITRPDIRWGRCDIKSIALLPNILATQSAKEQACNETILYRDERVTEGASSNVFAVVGGTVVTPPKGPEILPGVTRDLVIELLRAGKTPVAERALSLAELRGAEEIWLTSSTREVLPVTQVDGKPVGNGKPGPMWAAAHALFQDRKRRT